MQDIQVYAPHASRKERFPYCRQIDNKFFYSVTGPSLVLSLLQCIQNYNYLKLKTEETDNSYSVLSTENDLENYLVFMIWNRSVKLSHMMLSLDPNVSTGNQNQRCNKCMQERRSRKRLGGRKKPRERKFVKQKQEDVEMHK